PGTAGTTSDGWPAGQNSEPVGGPDSGKPEISDAAETKNALKAGQGAGSPNKSREKLGFKPALNIVPPVFRFTPTRHLPLNDVHRRQLTASHVAYLKIAEGCDRFCSYCAIPSIRGRFVSKPKDDILTEAEKLADSGVRELVLIAQETTFWGTDLYGQPRLAELLARLRERGWFDWIRLLYTYPLFFSDELISLFGFPEENRSDTSPASMSGERKETVLLPYIDLPLQHCNDELLRKMNRKIGKSETEELLARLREKIPELSLRTSMIVGFPGETEAMFNELVEFMEKWKFERAGIFAFSPETGTPAATLPDQVPDRIKQSRQKKLYAKQERIARIHDRRQLGRVIPVMIDEQGTDENGSPLSDLFLGRAWFESPDVDPIVYVTGRDIPIGEIVLCEVVDIHELDLIAVPFR
ncbi:MAG: MiaB/RimO family radical SAM methylthiotransferase, partial [Thermoguttaceae bacterium]|nr:MiaB/RimO family radical SAM methylthiotransferase [Thermoguttaceae bacterium]